MILSLDIGTRMGWAFGETDIWDHGTFKLPSPWGHDAAVALFTIAHNFKTKFKVTQLHCEKVGGQFYNSNKALLGMLGVLNLVYNDQQVVQYSPTTIKKYWTESGKARKPHMIAITQMFYPDVHDDNESDAIAIWHYATRDIHDIILQGG